MAQKKVKVSKHHGKEISVSQTVDRSADNVPEAADLARIVAGSSLVSHRAVLSPNGAWVLCICGTEVRIFSRSSGDLASILRDFPSHPITGLALNAISPHSQIYAVSSVGRFVLWAYDTGVQVKAWDLYRETVGLYSPYRGRGPYVLLRSAKKAVNENTVKEGTLNGENEAETSCTLSYVSLNNLRIRPVLSGLCADGDKIAFHPKGDYVAAINGNALLLFFWEGGLYKRHLMSSSEGRQFTCIAVHPQERCIATGDTQGRIMLWHKFEDQSKVIRTILHWHSSSVLDLAFSAEGSYLWSGGRESTLVQWSLNKTDQPDFMPRMGAAITHLAVSYDGNVILVSHADSVITLVGLQRNILGTISSLFWSDCFPVSRVGEQSIARSVLALDPVTQSFVLRGKPGQLQLFDGNRGKLLPPIDVANQNIMSSGLNNFLNATVDAVCFGCTGGVGSEESGPGVNGERRHTWMVTADSLRTNHVGSMINLKFWEHDRTLKRYIVRTAVVDPHDQDPVRWMAWNRHSTEGVVVTLSEASFKVWMALPEQTLTGTRTIWACIGEGRLKECRPSSCSFSPDGATLAVSFGHIVAFYDVGSVGLREPVLSTLPADGAIRNIAYGARGTDSLLVTTDKTATFWNLSTLTQAARHETPATFLAESSDATLFAVGNESRVLVLDANDSGRILFQCSPSSPPPAWTTCLLIPSQPQQNEDGINVESSPAWLRTHRLLLLSENGELWTVDGKGSANSRLGERRVLELEEEKLTPYAQFKATVLEDATAFAKRESSYKHDKNRYVSKLLTVAAYTLPKPEYFLTEHLNSLLRITDEKEDDGDTRKAMDGAEDMDVDAVVVSNGGGEKVPSDDEEMPETSREPVSQEEIGAGDDAESLDTPALGVDQKFAFLTESVKLLRSSSGTSSGRRSANSTAVDGKRSAKSVYANMSQLYQNIRAEAV